MARRTGKKRNASKETESQNPTTMDSQAQVNDSVESEKGNNDVAWYARDPQLTLDAARIPFSQPFGSTLPIGNSISDNTGREPSWIQDTVFDAAFHSNPVAGICTEWVKPSFGTNGKKTDPVNVCANAFYTHVRYMNSGRKNYDPQDLFMYAATFGELISFIVFCKRLYSYAFMYSQRNYYIGKALIEACGFDANSIINNLANFRYWINVCINKISSFCLPGDIYYFNRRAFMFGNFYIENPFGNIKDQLYQFAPDGFYRFEIDEETGSGKLAYHTLNVTSGSAATIYNLMDYFDFLFENITGDEDFGIMSGDILKAYGDNRIFLGTLGEDATLMPTYDPYVLSQFKNATVIPIDRGSSDYTYKVGNSNYYAKYGELVQVPGDGNLYSREAVHWLDDASSEMGTEQMKDISLRLALQVHSNALFSSENPNPEVGDVVEGTRLMVCRSQFEPTLSDGHWTQTVDTGTEIVNRVTFTKMAGWNQSRQDVYEHYVLLCSTVTDRLFIGDSAGKYNVEDFAYFSQFKYCPNIWLWVCRKDDSDHVYHLSEVLPMNNIDNTTLVASDNLRRIHEMALLSLFFVPGVAKIL